MPAIADQVTSLENDHAAALATIDQLNSKNSALTDALAAMTTAKTAVEAQLADMAKHVDDVKAMVENVANGALSMLKSIAAKAETTAKSAVAEGAKVTTEVERAVTTGIGAALGLAPEAPAPVLATATTLPTPSPVAGVTVVPLASGATLGEALAAVANIVPPAAPESKPTLVTQVESAVDRMLHHSSGVAAHITPEDLTLHVDHDDGGLPIFLRRGTVFMRGDRAHV